MVPTGPSQRGHPKTKVSLRLRTPPPPHAPPAAATHHRAIHSLQTPRIESMDPARPGPTIFYPTLTQQPWGTLEAAGESRWQGYAPSQQQLPAARGGWPGCASPYRAGATPLAQRFQATHPSPSPTPR